MTKTKLVVILAAASLAVSVLAIRSVAAPGAGHLDAAEKAARIWLDHVDHGRWDASWDSAARFFKDAVPQETWRAQISSVRKPLGEVISRKVKSRTYAKSLPGAPDGEYVVIELETTFSEKKSAVETITPMRQKDGSWRVSGYYIR